MGQNKLSPSTVLDTPILDRIIVGIGEVANITGVSPRQIRYWEAKGIIHSVGNDSGASRKYDYANIEKIVLIKDFLDQGYTLEAAARRLEERIFQLNQAIEKLQQNYLNNLSADKALVGKQLELYGQDYTVIGVADFPKGDQKLLICQPVKGDKSSLLAEPLLR